MCLIAWAWGLHADCPLLIASNRDEYWDRPTLPLERWHPEGDHAIYSGRDARAGGTWLGFNATGRVAMLTNVQQADPVVAPRSRGELTLWWLHPAHAGWGWETLVERCNPADFAGFNLVMGDQRTGEWIWLSNRAATPGPEQGCLRLPSGWVGARLSPGVYGVSNASLDTPWPKTVQLKNAVTEAIQTDPAQPVAVDRLLDALQQTPDMGDESVSDLQRQPFIHRPQARYGTRSTLIARQLRNPQGYSLNLQEWTYDPARLRQPLHHRDLSISTWGMPTSR